MPEPRVRKSVDAAYYRRFYRDGGTAVISRGEVSRLAGFVLAYMNFMNLRCRNVLDVGCGIGYWRDALRKHDRNIIYTGVEVSAYLCERYGWQQRSITEFKSRRHYDLIVCQGVFQYLDKNDVRSGIENLARVCRGALYLEVYTREDQVNANVDARRTDQQVHLRSVRWYRRIIGEHFAHCGGGVFIPHESGVVRYELEKG